MGRSSTVTVTVSLCLLGSVYSRCFLYIKFANPQSSDYKVDFVLSSLMDEGPVTQGVCSGAQGHRYFSDRIRSTL